MLERQEIKMERKKDEKMIYIKDLIFAALRRWRSVLAVAVLLALVLGGWKGVSGLSALKTPVDIAAQQEALALYETEKTSVALKIEAIQQSIDNQQTYLDNSVLMQVDPYGYYEAVLSLYVETDYQIMPGMSYQNPDRTNSVLYAYRAVAQGRETLDALAQSLSSQSQYVSELLTAELPEKTAGTLVIRVMAPDAAAAQQLLEVLSAQLEAAYDQVTQAVAEHTVRVVEQSVSAKVDLTLADSQKKELNRMNDLMTALADAQTAMDTLQEPAVQTGSVASVVKKAVIFAVLGAVAGVFLTVCVIWVMHIASGKVYSARTLQDRTGVKVIGCAAHRKIKCGLDRRLYAWEGRNTAPVQEHLAADISCRAKDAKCLLVTGSGSREDREELVQAVSKAMPGAQVQDCGSILTDAAALQALTDCDAVVLVEACDVSDYDGVSRQLELIEDYNKQLLGCVLLDG